MKAKILYDANYGYTVVIEKLWIITEWDNFEELIQNLQEALELANEDKTEKIKLSDLDFNLSLTKNASILQTAA